MYVLVLSSYNSNSLYILCQIFNLVILKCYSNQSNIKVYFFVVVLGSSSKSSQSFKETDITELINLGFSREQVNIDYN